MKINGMKLMAQQFSVGFQHNSVFDEVSRNEVESNWEGTVPISSIQFPWMHFLGSGHQSHNKSIWIHIAGNFDSEPRLATKKKTVQDERWHILALISYISLCQEQDRSELPPDLRHVNHTNPTAGV